MSNVWLIVWTQRNFEICKLHVYYNKFDMKDSLCKICSSSLLDDATFHPRICYPEFRQTLLPSLPRPIKHCSSFGVDREKDEAMVEAAVWKSRRASSWELGTLRRERLEKSLSRCFPEKNSERRQESYDIQSNRNCQVCGDFQFQSIDQFLSSASVSRVVSMASFLSWSVTNVASCYRKMYV